MADAEVERVLAITAHPDDIDFGASATLAKWSDMGIEVHLCVVTDGDAGGFDRDVPRSEIPSIRRAEQQEAAAEWGAKEVFFLGYRDGELTVSHDLRRDISRVIRQVRPRRVLVQSPERNWERIYASHPDHLAAGEAALEAVYPDSRNPFAHPSLLNDEGLEAWTVEEVWVMAGPEPNYAVDITDTLPRKIAALQKHVSQTSHMDNLETLIGDWGRLWAERFELPEGHLAEAYQVVNTA
jgi:LmbE family N-acetylglucosaminyl deacetylase